ncbi:MAG: 6,7-dimethyl-8-ribityllumazine synthase [Isosphaeraceae bacterium]|nr:6,7-dimethyl-8-ribityllumazine synthase [Isosphaeraceae bacterium]
MSKAGKRIAIVAADFNKDLVDTMVEVARQELDQAAAILARVVRVPGAFETPLVADVLLDDPGVDGLVVLGHIERGETLHGEVMGHVVHTALVQLQLKHRKPVGMGIIGPGATPEQAEARKHSAALAAVRATLRLCEILTNEVGPTPVATE